MAKRLKRHRFFLQSVAFFVIMISSALLYWSVAGDHFAVTVILMAVIAAAMLTAILL
jgi:hypothetical protein